MIKPILMVSALALAGAASAQSSTNDDLSQPRPGSAATGSAGHDQHKPTGQTTTSTATGTVQQPTTQTGATDDPEPDTSAGGTATETMRTTGTGAGASAQGTPSTTGTTAMPGTGGNAAGGTGSATSTGMGGPADIQGQWSSYDSDGNGSLTPLEFGKWMMEANGQGAMNARVDATRTGRQSNLPAINVLNMTAGALARADTNGDWMVSREELMAYSPQ